LREKWEMQTGSRFPGLRRRLAHKMKAIDSGVLWWGQLRETPSTGRMSMWGKRLWITTPWSGHCHKPSKAHVTRTFRFREGSRLARSHRGDLSKRLRTLRK